MARRAAPASRAPRLDRTQRWMLEVITHPGGAADGMMRPEARRRHAVDAGSLERVVRPSRRLTSLQRLQIYHEQYFLRLIEVLAGEFPTVQRVLGPEAFGRWATAYLVAHPPDTYRLGVMGRGFPAFVRDEAEGMPHRAFLADVAALERTMEDVFDEEPAEPVSVDALLAVPRERWPQARFRTIPALRLLSQRHPVNDFVRAARGEGPLRFPRPRASWLVVFRRDWRVWRAPLTREQHALLGALVAGKTLAEALADCLATRGASARRVGQTLHGWFRDWAADGLFAGVEEG